MDEQLAAIYGTNQSEMDKEAAQQTEAEAEYIAKVAADNDIDLDQLSEEQLAEFAGNVLEQAYAEEQPDESQEKVAEADFLGRVMAHAYAQELGEIEKQAAEEKAPMHGPKERFFSKAKRKVVEGVKAPFTKEYYTAAHGDIGKAFRGAAKGGAEGIGARAAALGKGVARYAPHAAAAGGAALLAHKLLKKKSAADLEKVAEERAAQLLMEQGWMDEQGNMLYQPGQEKVAEEMTFEQAAEVRALQMLEENGFPVTWTE